LTDQSFSPDSSHSNAQVISSCYDEDISISAENLIPGFTWICYFNISTND